VLSHEESLLDTMLAGQPAQYASSSEKPLKPWAEVTTTLSDLDTSKVHFVKPGLQHVVIDFDIRGDDGEKDLGLNLKAASIMAVRLMRSSAKARRGFIFITSTTGM